MNTVQREPRSTGFVDWRAARAKDATSWFIVWANVCRKLPQPELQASLTAMESTAPPRMRRYFMSWPPMSMTLVTPGATRSAAR